LKYTATATEDAMKSLGRTGGKPQEDAARWAAKARARRGFPETIDASCVMISAGGIDRMMASMAASA
jgi:hypothetical protein